MNTDQTFFQKELKRAMLADKVMHASYVALTVLFCISAYTWAYYSL
jgi:uncharacterized membrane protein YqgA involved in biofilm formation